MSRWIGRRQLLFIFVLMGLMSGRAYAQSPPVVSHVHAEQIEGTGQVRVVYDLQDADDEFVTVTLRVSDDGGYSFVIPAFHCSGDVYNRIAPGSGKVFLWDASQDVPGHYGENWEVEVIARDGTVVDFLPGGVPIEFVRIAPGTFTMGSSTGFSNEVPPHQVTLTQPFYLGIYEITQAQWESVMGFGTGPWIGKDLTQEGPFYPAAYISWDDLQAFLGRLNNSQEEPSDGDNGDTPAAPGTDDVFIEALPGGGNMGFVWIEPGTFMMGASESEEGWLEDEAPQHQVTISQGFYLGRFEITQAQWESVMGTRPWAEKDYVREDPDCPAVYFEWQDVQSFIQRLNAAAGDTLYRLPTEAEWEYAARAGTMTRWSFGDDEGQLGDYAWYRENAWEASRQHALAVGMKQSNPWGLYDMHGNVWEWVQDWYDTYPAMTQTDPTGPPSGAYRVLRGGSFSDYAPRLRVASRLAGTPHPRRYVMGARLLRQGPCKVPSAAPKSLGEKDEVKGMYRLPTEAEWEYAARAGTTTRWSFGDDEGQLGDYAWYRANATDRGEHYGHQVGTLLPNPWGLYDVHGNLWESVQDFYGPYPSQPQTDPTGPATGAFNVHRGGGFANDRFKDLTSSRRGGSPPYNCGWCMGARLAKNVDELFLEDAATLDTLARGTHEGQSQSNLFLLDTRQATVINLNGTEEYSVQIPFTLFPNEPNPFNGGTTIRFALPTSEEVELAVFNLRGQKVTTLIEGAREAGTYTVSWDGCNDDGQELASGAYLYRLRAADGKQVETRKLLLLR